MKQKSWQNRILNTISLTLLVFVLLIVILETIVRQPAIQADLLPSSLGSTHRQLDYQFAYLDQFVQKDGHIECLLIGSSMPWVDIDPEVFAESYRAEADEDLNCYNFGIEGLGASSQAELATILVKKYAPDLVILGTASRDFHPSDFRFTNDTLDFPWWNYWLGKKSLEGWLVENSALYRYWNTYREWYFANQAYTQLSPFGTKEDTLLADMSPLGYLPRIGADLVSSPNWLIQRSNLFYLRYPWYLYDEHNPLAQEDVAGWETLLSLDTRLLVVEMPMSPMGFYRSRPNQMAFLQLIAEPTCQKGIPVFYVNQVPLFTLEDWKDDGHLNVQGAIIFSHWLGEQIGQATRTNFDFENPKRTFCNYEAPSMDTLGLTPTLFDDYQAWHGEFDLLPEDALVFNANVQFQSAIAEQMAWGSLITLTEPADPNYIFDLMVILERSQFEADFEDEVAMDLRIWQTTGSPDLLTKHGFQYVLVTEFWKSWLSEDFLNLLADPNIYEPIAEWKGYAGQEDYVLLKITG